MPGSKQAWPNSAACWSPAIPAIGICAIEQARRGEAEQVAIVVDLGQQRFGNAEEAAEILSQRSADVEKQRAAGVGHVGRVDAPPVSRHSRKLSIVPHSSSPRSARSRAPATLSRIQAILVAEK